jgi:flagellar motor switch protein FliN/FliY
MSDEEDVNQDEVGDDWAAAMAEQDDSGQEDIDAVLSEQKNGDNAGGGATPVEMEELQSSGGVTGDMAPDLDVILDIPIRICMEVGNTQINIRNLLQLNQGSVIELDRLAGEPLDVLVNGTLIAHGEVVVVNEKFGIRMTDVISPSERIKKLK